MHRRSTDYIVVHCAATPPSLNIGVAEIRSWHVARGWSDIGYHYVIRRDGRVEEGRPETEIGSHVKGHNANSLGVCLVGGTDTHQRPRNNFTEAQWAALKRLLVDLQSRYPRAVVLGHRDFPRVAKACPCFEAIGWARKEGLHAARPLRPATAALLRPVNVETEDGDEQDEVETQEATAPRKWITAILGSGGVGSLAGLGYGSDWAGTLAWMGGFIVLVCLILYLMGYQRRERLWDRLVGP